MGYANVVLNGPQNASTEVTQARWGMTTRWLGGWVAEPATGMRHHPRGLT